jgi:hypothetical protein
MVEIPQLQLGQGKYKWVSSIYAVSYFRSVSVLPEERRPLSEYRGFDYRVHE